MRFRFHKGDKVEVLCKGEVPSGSWRYGIIESGNGHTYYIRYESHTSATGAPVLQRVPRKAIRPSQPSGNFEDWAAGDLIEVFDNFSWKFGKVLKVTNVDHFLIRLLGTSEKVEAHVSCLRLPHSWQDERWVPINKGTGDIENRKSTQKTGKRAYNKSMEKDSPCKKFKAVANEDYTEYNEGERSGCSVGSSGMSYKEEEGEREETHERALDRYYETMESLRALGYLTWEQEEMITDLRLKLRISNDQHLMELRKLVAAQ
ncbi:hypothetical protein ACHQM5_029230 [Ranunculus cassubicifolius]